MRLMAVVSLLLWLAASGICSVECAGGFQHCAGGAHSCCHPQSVSASGQSRGSEPQHSHDSSICISLHSLHAPAASALVTRPDAAPIFALNFISTADLAEVTAAKVPVSRQLQPADPLSRPEVSLGAASRSHAPPVLS
jgi:hypothetical protein